MMRINTDTFTFFGDPLLSLKQAVEDILLTIPGERRHRPEYGSYLTDPVENIDRRITSIYRALEQVDGVQTVRVLVDHDTLRVIINGAPKAVPYNPVLALSFDGSILTWGEEELAW